MRKQHIILLSMLALAILAAGAVAAVKMFSGAQSSPQAAQSRVYRIAVATEETIGRREEISASATETPGAGAAQFPGAAQSGPSLANGAGKSLQEKLMLVLLSEQSLPPGASDPVNPADGKGKPGDKGSAGAKGSATQLSAEPAKPTVPQQPTVSLTTEDLRQILGAQLEGQLTGALAATKRFDPLEVTQVQAAIDKLRQSDEPGSADKKKKEAQEARSPGPLESVGRLIGSVRQSARVQERPDGSARKQELTSREEIRRRFIDGANLADVGGTLQADYFLFVTIDEPLFSYRQVETALGKRRLIFTAQPTYLYRLFNVRTGTVELAGVTQLPQPITEGVDWDPLTRERVITADPKGVRETESVTRVISNLTFKVNQTVSRLVVQSILDKISPAKVVRANGKIVINRGSNDGVVAGQEMEVYRLGSEIRDEGDSGAVLGREQRYLGVVRVVDVQESSATVEIAGGDQQPAVGDVVRLAAASPAREQAESALPAADAVGPGGVPLGEAAILEQQAGGAQKPLVAVGEVSVGFRGGDDFSIQAARRLADALQRNPRITVLPRADIERVLKERALNAEAKGDFSSLESEGLAQSGFVVTGEVFIENRTTQDSVSFGGVTRPSGPARTSYLARGSFRAQTIDGKLVKAADASITRAGSTPSDALAAIDALMQAGAEKLLRALFPIRVIRQDGAEVVLGAGQDAGLAVGQRLVVYSIGAPVIDPLTKVELSPGSRRQAGQLIVRTVDVGSSTAGFVGAQVALKPGDVVEAAGASAAGAATTPRGSGARSAAPAREAEDAAPPVRF